MSLFVYPLLLLSSRPIINADNTIGILAVGILWGCTNPFLNSGGKNAHKQENESHSFWSFFIHLWTNLKFLIPYGLNQLGSVLFFFLLGRTNMSITIPVTNAVNFIFTAITSKAIGESTKFTFRMSTVSFLGILIMAIGVSICISETANN